MWLRTKKRSVGTWYPWPRMASQRISALLSFWANQSGGSGLTIPFLSPTSTSMVPKSSLSTNLVGKDL